MYWEANCLINKQKDDTHRLHKVATSSPPLKNSIYTLGSTCFPSVIGTPLPQFWSSLLEHMEVQQQPQERIGDHHPLHYHIQNTHVSKKIKVILTSMYHCIPARKLAEYNPQFILRHLQSQFIPVTMAMAPGLFSIGLEKMTPNPNQERRWNLTVRKLTTTKL